MSGPKAIGLNRADRETRRRVTSMGGAATCATRPDVMDKVRKMGKDVQMAMSAFKTVSLGQRILHTMNEDVLKKSQDEMSKEIRDLLQVFIDVAKDETQSGADRCRAANLGLIWLCGLPKQRVEVKQKINIGLSAATRSIRELKMVKEQNNRFVDDLNQLDDPLVVIDDQPASDLVADIEPDGAVEPVPSERDGAAPLPE